MVRVDVTSFAADPDVISIRELPIASILAADEENCLRHVIVGVGIPVATQVILIVPPGRTRGSSAVIVAVGATEHYVGFTALTSELLHLSCQTDSLVNNRNRFKQQKYINNRNRFSFSRVHFS